MRGSFTRVMFMLFCFWLLGFQNANGNDRQDIQAVLEGFAQAYSNLDETKALSYVAKSTPEMDKRYEMDGSFYQSVQQQIRDFVEEYDIKNDGARGRTRWRWENQFSIEIDRIEVTGDEAQVLTHTQVTQNGRNQFEDPKLIWELKKTESRCWLITGFVSPRSDKDYDRTRKLEKLMFETSDILKTRDVDRFSDWLYFVIQGEDRDPLKVRAWDYLNSQGLTPLKDYFNGSSEDDSVSLGMTFGSPPSMSIHMKENKQGFPAIPISREVLSRYVDIDEETIKNKGVFDLEVIVGKCPSSLWGTDGKYVVDYRVGVQEYSKTIPTVYGAKHVFQDVPAGGELLLSIKRPDTLVPWLYLKSVNHQRVSLPNWDCVELKEDELLPVRFLESHHEGLKPFKTLEIRYRPECKLPLYRIDLVKDFLNSNPRKYEIQMAPGYYYVYGIERATNQDVLIGLYHIRKGSGQIHDLTAPPREQKSPSRGLRGRR